MLPIDKNAFAEKPKFCVLEVSHRCPLQCKICNYWKVKEDHSEVNIEIFRQFVSSLKKFIGSPFEMNISGGEPLLKNGALDLVEFIASLGFKFSLATNGYLINETIAKRIADSGLNYLAISLDSLNESTHDYIRGVKGAYLKVMGALEYFIAYRGKLQNIAIQAVIMEPSVEGLPDLVYWAHNRGIALSFIAITRPNMIPADPQWHKDKRFSFLWPKETAKVLKSIDELIRLKKDGYRIDNPYGQLEKFKLYFTNPDIFVKETPCSLGADFLHVNPRGDVHLCCEMESVGNIKEADIDALWSSEKAQSIRNRIKLCRKNCASMVNCYREGL